MSNLAIQRVALKRPALKRPKLLRVGDADPDLLELFWPNMIKLKADQTFTGEATVVVDHEQLIHSLPANCPAYYGGRVEENLFSGLSISSEDLLGFTAKSGATIDGDGVTFNISVSSSGRIEPAVIGDSSYVGKTFTWSPTLSGPDGEQVNIQIQDATTGTVTSKTITLTSLPLRYNVTRTIAAGATGVIVNVRRASVAVSGITYHNGMLADVTSRSNQNPPEYIPVGVATGSEISGDPDLENESYWQNIAEGVTFEAGGVDINYSGSFIVMFRKLYLLTEGKDYYYTLTCTEYTSGSITLYIGDNNTETISSIGTFSDIQNVGVDALQRLQLASSAFVGKLSLVSVKPADSGANVSGIKYFTDTNPNDVIDGVVLEGAQERVPSTTFEDWADSSVPDGWTKKGTHNGSNYVEENNGIRVVSDGTYVGVGLFTYDVGRKYIAEYEYSDKTLGTLSLDMATGVPLTADVGVRSTMVFAGESHANLIKRAAACDCTLSYLSIKPHAVGVPIDRDIYPGGDFDVLGTGYSMSGDSLVATAVAQYVKSNKYIEESLTAGAWYDITWTVSDYSVGDPYLDIASGNSAFTGSADVQTGAGTFTTRALCDDVSTDKGIVFGNNNASAMNCKITIDSIKQVVGGYMQNPAGTQLLTQTEDFSHVDWDESSGVTVTANDALSPDGKLTADKLVGTGSSYHAQSALVFSAGSVTQSCFVKSASGSDETFRLYIEGNTLSGDMTATTAWQRFDVEHTATGGGNGHGIARDSLGNDFSIHAFGINATETDYLLPYIKDDNTRAAGSLDNGTWKHGNNNFRISGKCIPYSVNQESAVATQFDVYLDSNNRLRLYYSGVLFTCNTEVGGTNLYPASPNVALVAGEEITWEVELLNGEITISANGVAGTPATVGEMSLEGATVHAGELENGTSQFNGNIFDIEVTKLPDTSIYKVYPLLGKLHPSMTFERASTKTVVLDGEVIEKAIDEPCFGDNGYSQSPEFEQLLTWTDDFSHANWSTTRSSVSANATLAPDGTLADEFIEDSTASATHALLQSGMSFTSGEIYTLSLFVKKNTREEVSMLIAAGPWAGSQSCFFNVDTGLVGSTVGGASGKIEALADGWYRCTLTTSVVTSTTSANVIIYLSDGAESIAYNGDGSSGLYIWRANITESSYLLPATKTEAATYTTEADDLQLPWIDKNNDFSISVNVTPYSVEQYAAGVRLFEIYIDSNNYWALYLDGSGLSLVSRIAGVSEYSNYAYTLIAGTTFNAKGIQNSDGITAFVNDDAGIVMASGSIASGGTAYIGQKFDGTYQFNGEINGLEIRHGANL